MNTEETPRTPAPFDEVSTLITRSLNIHHVFGDPVERYGTTVIPVATVAYGFGAGGGRGPRPKKHRNNEETAEGNGETVAQGAGGGGGVKMTPTGVIEIGPSGTRFVRFNNVLQLLGAAVGGACTRRSSATAADGMIP